MEDAVCLMKLPEDISSKIPQAKIVILLGRNKSRHDEVRLVSLMNELSCIMQIFLNTITAMCFRRTEGDLIHNYTEKEVG